MRMERQPEAGRAPTHVLTLDNERDEQKKHAERRAEATAENNLIAEQFVDVVGHDRTQHPRSDGQQGDAAEHEAKGWDEEPSGQLSRHCSGHRRTQHHWEKIRPGLERAEAVHGLESLWNVDESGPKGRAGAEADAAEMSARPHRNKGAGHQHDETEEGSALQEPHGEHRLLSVFWGINMFLEEDKYNEEQEAGDERADDDRAVPWVSRTGLFKAKDYEDSRCKEQRGPDDVQPSERSPGEP